MDNYIENIELNNDTGVYPSKWMMYLFGIYVFFSFFETYLTKFVGTSTKYYLLGMIGIFLYSFKYKIRLNNYSKLLMAWFAFKLLSIMWASFSPMTNSNVSTHFISQCGMILFVIVFTTEVFCEEFLSFILKANFWCSLLFGVLSIVFQGSYISEVYSVRKVLTLWGLQNDPNNCAAFLLIGITLALYALVFERKHLFLDVVAIAINTYALFLSSSRGGFLSLAVIIILVLFLPTSQNGMMIKGTTKKIVLLAIILIVTIYFIQHYLPTAVLERLLDFQDYEGGSGRTVRWDAALELFYQKPIFGWGWGGYDIGSGYGAIHNTFLTSLCDVGVFGTLLLILPMILILVYSLKMRNSLVCMLLTCGLLPSMFLDAINKRFFWNAIVISIMLIMYQQQTGDSVGVWKKNNL